MMLLAITEWQVHQTTGLSVARRLTQDEKHLDDMALSHMTKLPNAVANLYDLTSVREETSQVGGKHDSW